MILIQRESSPVDWCETNYEYSPYVAEFFNSFSSLLYSMLSLIALWKSRNLEHQAVYKLRKTHWMLVLVGFGSFYFHATLSAAGQMMDELSILWLALITFYFFCPLDYGLQRFSEHKLKCVGAFAVLGTIFAVAFPWLNSVCLMLVTIPFVKRVLCFETSSMRLSKLKNVPTILFPLSVAAWLLDRTMCSYWLQVDFAYFHSLWHILSAISAIYAATCVCCAHAKEDLQNGKLVLKFWPYDQKQFLIPYLLQK